jgi:hypothetical protein
LQTILQDRVNLQVKEEKVEMIVSDSDDPAQKGIFSDN